MNIQKSIEKNLISTVQINVCNLQLIISEPLYSTFIPKNKYTNNYINQYKSSYLADSKLHTQDFKVVAECQYYFSSNKVKQITFI